MSILIKNGRVIDPKNNIDADLDILIADGKISELNKNLDPKKRPVSVVADNVEFRHVLTVNVYLNKNKTFRLLYDKKYGLKERNLAEQFKF